MATESGKLVGIAFEAVRNCHQDVGRLIADFDGYMKNEGMKRVWNQDAVTSGVSRAGYAQYWMAKQLYRLYYDAEKNHKTVDGLNIRFFSDDGRLQEPRLIIGSVVYNVPPTKEVDKVAWMWDLDKGYHEWCNATEADFNKPLTCTNADDSRIERMCVVALDLYSIKSIEDVKTAMALVRRNLVA